MTDVASLIGAKAPVASRTLIRRPDDLTDEQIKGIAKLWWDKHSVDVYTCWVQGIQTQPIQTIMAVMANCVPGLALHSDPQDVRFFTEIETLFRADLK